VRADPGVTCTASIDVLGRVFYCRLIDHPDGQHRAKVLGDVQVDATYQLDAGAELAWPVR
jgi:hypothetical protein